VARDGTAYRRSGEVWLEGDHLCAAAAGGRGVAVRQALVSEAGWVAAGRRELAGMPSAWPSAGSAVRRVERAGVAGRHRLRDAGPAGAGPDAALASVVLDRLQDAGNVGSILRSAAALGVSQVLAVKGTAALWSPKVLRAGMGAHFGLRLVEGLTEDDVLSLGLRLVGTSSHGGEPLPRASLPQPVAWLLGHEGQGVSPRLLACVHCHRGHPAAGRRGIAERRRGGGDLLYEAPAQRRQ
jgi:TrmH family RNA methyltransferase